MDQKISSLYDDYKQGRTNRRQFLRKLALVTGSSAAAMALLPVLDMNGTAFKSSDQADPYLISEFIKFTGETGEVKGFLSRPKSGNKFPAVLIIHENRGLQPHIPVSYTHLRAHETVLDL